MKWENFTAGRVDGFKCAPDKKQSIFWDGKTPGLGVRVTAAGARSYIFETSLRGKTIRITIGAAGTGATWTVADAQAKATAYKMQTDSGIDPRKVKQDEIEAEQRRGEAAEAQAAADTLKAAQEAITVGGAWIEYVAERSPQWSIHHRDAHDRMIQLGGQKWKRGPKIRTAGPLASIADVRLVDLKKAQVESWAKAEVVTRPSSARLALRLLKAFLNWCAEHEDYAALITSNAAKSTKARESLGKERKKNDLLQREQLKAWFGAVRKISNPVISAYLQCLLLTGARREEMAALRWVDVDFQWQSLKLNDKIEEFRMVPLTPYVAHVMSNLPRRNEFVFSSPTSASGYIAEPRIAHKEALVAAGLPDMTLHGLRRSFATLSEWTETPTGISAQVQGHAPQGVREQNYIIRPLDLLRMWHLKIEAWMLQEAEIDFEPGQPTLRVVTVGTGLTNSA